MTCCDLELYYVFAKTHLKVLRLIHTGTIIVHVYVLSEYANSLPDINGAYSKQEYPGTQGGAAQLYPSDIRLSPRRRITIHRWYLFLGKTVLFMSATKSCFTVIKSIVRTVFNAACQTKKWAHGICEKIMLSWPAVLCVGVHIVWSHWGPLFSHEALKARDKRLRLSSQCVQA